MKRFGTKNVLLHCNYIWHARLSNEDTLFKMDTFFCSIGDHVRVVPLY